MWPDVEETHDMLRRVARDEDGAEDRLWASYREPLRRLIGLRLDPALGRRVDASDVVQEALVKASQRLSEYLRDPSVAFHVWLGGIARDQLIDQHRRHRLAGRRSLDRERSLERHAPSLADQSSIQLAERLRDPNPTPAAEALRLELGRRFVAAIDSLDPIDREVIALRHFDGLSNGEAAQALGLSDSAAGMRYLRALRRLRSILGESPSMLTVHPR